MGDDGRLADALVRKWTAIGTSVAVAVVWMLGTLGRPWRLFAVPGALTAGFYDLQARALLHGRLSVPAGTLLTEEFSTDRGPMMYFGIFPALLRLPFHVFVNGLDGRLTLFSCLVAVTVLSVAAARLARRAQRAVLGADAVVSPRWYAVVAAAPVLGTSTLFLGSRSEVYHENVLWGVAGAVLAFDAVQQWWWSRRTRDLVGAGLAAAIAVNSRPSVGLGPLLALAACAVLLAVARDWRRAGAALLAPVLAVSSYMAVNVARFGQLWGAPHRLQASYPFNELQQDAVRFAGESLFSWRFAVNNAVRYLDPWPGVMSPTRLFPFVEFGHTPGNVLSAPMNVQYTGSLPTAAPVLLVLAVVGAAWAVRRRQVAWLIVIGAAAVASLSTLGFWSSWHRYLADFVPLLVLGAAPGLWCARRWLADRSRSARVAVVVTAGLVAAVAALGQTGLALWTRHMAYLPDGTEQAAFIRFRYDLDDTLFGGRPPDVTAIRFDPDQPLPDATLGHLLVVDDCAGLYVGGFGWQPLALASGGGHRAVIAPLPEQLAVLTSGPTTVLRGDGWLLRSRPIADPTLLGLYYVNRFGKEIGVGVANIADGLPVLDVTADPVSRRFTVTQDGLLVINVPNALAGGMSVEPGWDIFESRSSLCDDLLARLQPTRGR